MTPDLATGILLYARRAIRCRNYLDWFCGREMPDNSEQRIESARHYIETHAELQRLERNLAAALAAAKEGTTP